ncbi:hypothetical protein JOC85_003445 [Bacillus mesophilus]|nr:hypothetical protein [Bacillus mesophilus]
MTLFLALFIFKKTTVLLFALLIVVEGRETPAGERVTGDPTGALFAEEAHGLARGKRVSCNENQQQGITEPIS